MTNDVLLMAAPLTICFVLYNNLQYSRILIGSHLWSIRGQMHDWWGHHFEVLQLMCIFSYRLKRLPRSTKHYTWKMMKYLKCEYGRSYRNEKGLQWVKWERTLTKNQNSLWKKVVTKIKPLKNNWAPLILDPAWGKRPKKIYLTWMKREIWKKKICTSHAGNRTRAAAVRALNPNH